MRRCVIVGGADIADYGRVRAYLRPDDFHILCDSGLRHAKRLGIEPDLIIGDFDSHRRPETDREIIVLPCEKDDTDTVAALKEAICRGFCDFLLLGVAGRRLDHTLGNVYILKYLSERGMKGLLVDDYSEMELLAPGSVAEIGQEYPYFSTLGICGPVRGINIRNAKYPLEDAEIVPGYQYGISNEPLPGKTATVSCREGELLIMRIIKG